MCEGFLPKFPLTCPKIAPKKMTSNKNDCISSHVGCIFKNQSTHQAPFLPKFPPNLPEKNKKMTSKKTSALSFWVPFLSNQSTYSDFVNLFTNFAQISTDFSRILSDFSRILAKSKVKNPPPTPVTL